MWTPALFRTKNFGFFEIYGVSAQVRRVEPVRTRGDEGIIFRDFVRTSFMDGPLNFSPLRFLGLNYA